MQRKNLSTFGKLTLAGILSVSGCGNRIAPQTLPANNPLTGRHMTLFEQDLRVTNGLLDQYNSDTFPVAECADGSAAVLTSVTLNDRNGRDAPFDIDVHYNANGTNTIEFVDNGRSFVDGEEWTVKVLAGCDGVYDSRRMITVGYHVGSSNGRLDDRLGNVEDVVFDFRVDDGECDSALGENVQNSPRDCYVPTTPVTPPITQPSLLEKADTWSCNNLEAANDTNIRVYAVTPVNNGATFNSREIAELIPGRNDQADSIYELIRSGSTSSFYVAVEGNTPSGQRVGETVRGMINYDDTKNPNAKMSSNAAGGYATDCGTYFINSNPGHPTPQAVVDGVFTVFSDGD